MPLPLFIVRSYTISRREVKYEDQFEERLFKPLLTEGMVTFPSVTQAEPGTLEAVKTAIPGHGEQTILPDDCQFADNDLCYAEA